MRLLRLVSLLVFGLVSAVGAAPGAEAPFPRPVNAAAVASRFPLDEGAEAMLRRNGFVVLDGVRQSSLHAAYPCSPSAGDGHVFVTSDAMLHLWYELHRALLMETEERVLHPRLCALVAALRDEAARMLSQSQDPVTRTALRRAAVALAVAGRLLEEDAPVTPELKAEVDALVGKVMAHSEVAAWPGEDYTQYTVRGHYAARQELSRYFRGSLWLSRHILSVDPDPGSDPNAGLREAAALAAVLRACPEARKALESVNAARGYLTGVPNAIGVEQVIGALDRVAGRGWRLPGAVSASTLKALRAELARDAYPRARVHTRPDVPVVPFPQKVIALLPDYAIPDSALFQQTVEAALPGRSLPSGLQVAAGLGSPVARERIRATERDAGALLAAGERFRADLEQETASIYGAWLRVLGKLFVEDARAPEFMRRDAWRSEKVNTCLSSWAQLRHSYLLYGAQSYAAAGISEALPALVEPLPHFHRALGAMAEETLSRLASLGALPEGREGTIREFAAQCSRFAEYAEAELSGTLTRAQSERIDAFGAWLERFKFTSEPLVADVATGADLEVLHVGTGPFNPILVIPDRANPVAYVGWVSSYYEFVRPPTERMTDAQWQALCASPVLRPERPEWAREFVHVDRGDAWQTRAPLREAERLFLAGNAGRAVVLLRRIVATEPDSPLATEAQYRIGRHFYDQGEYDVADAELRKCEYLYGCDASDVARSLAAVATRRKDWESKREAERKARREAVEAAAVPGLKPAERQRRVLAAASAVLRDLDVDSGTRAPLHRLAGLCGSQELREKLLLTALMAERRASRLGSPGVSQEWLVDECVRFARSVSSPAVRATALALAVDLGLHRDDPPKALALVRPYLKDSPSTASTPFLPPSPEGAPYIVDLDLDAHFVCTCVEDTLRNSVVTYAFHHGQLDAMREYADAFPRREGDGGGSAPSLPLLDALGVSDRVALAEFGKAEGLAWAGDHRNAADAYLALSLDHPRSRLAPYALYRAAAGYRRVEHVARARSVADVLVREYAETYPGTVQRAQDAFGAGDDALARQLVGRCEESDQRRPRWERDLLCYATSGLKQDLQRRDALLAALRPVVTAAGRPELLKGIPPAGDAAARAADRLCAAIPDRRAEVLLALLPRQDRRVPWSTEEVALRFLREFPDHPQAAGVWADVPRTASAPDVVAAYVNRGPNAPNAAAALTGLGRVLGTSIDGPPPGTDDSRRLAPRRIHLRPARANVRLLQARHPETRAADAAACELASALVLCRRPEEALEVLREVMPRLREGDPLRARAEEVAARAREETRRKQERREQLQWGAPVLDTGSPETR